jgi:hypothetical protein
LTSAKEGATFYHKANQQGDRQMKIQKKAALSVGYTLSYDRCFKAYKAEKVGFNTLYWSKLEFEAMPVYKLIQALNTNDLQE